MSTDVKLKMNKKKNFEFQHDIVKTWISGQRSCTLIIPKEIAVKYGLDEPSHVAVECIEQGILIRKISQYR
jgi:hypothetical protein